MRRIITIGLLLLVVTLQAQELKSLYVTIPDSLSPLLTNVNRQDFGDFLSSNMKAEVRNRFGNSSEMTKMTSDYLELKLTSVSKVNMKVLAVDDSTKVICVAKTYQGPVEDTQISFYSTKWEKLDTNEFIDLPTKDDFFIQPIKTEKRDSLEFYKAQADVHLMKAELSDQEQTLTFTYTTPNFMEETMKLRVGNYLSKKPLTYFWEKGRFERKK